MPRITHSEKLHILNVQLSSLLESEEIDDETKITIDAINYERKWLKEHQKFEGKDKANHALNKGFEMSIQDEFAAKYGLGPSTRTESLKKVTNYKQVKYDSKLGQVSATYQATTVTGQDREKVMKIESKSHQFCEFTGDVETGFQSALFSQEVLRALDAHIKSLGEHRSPGVIGITTSQHIVSNDSKWIETAKQINQIFGSKVTLVRNIQFPQELCSFSVIEGNRTYQYLSRVPQSNGSISDFVMSCFCGKSLHLKGLGTGKGSTDANIKVQYRRPGTTTYLVKIPVGLLGKDFTKQQHHEVIIRDDVMHSLLEAAIEAFDTGQ